jgi:hypothetical protein
MDRLSKTGAVLEAGVNAKVEHMQHVRETPNGEISASIKSLTDLGFANTEHFGELLTTDSAPFECFTNKFRGSQHEALLIK